MATPVAQFRLVRCPKCLRLLPEIANVPMYKCGGCGVILRAKNRVSSKQNVSLAPEASSSQNLGGNDSLKILPSSMEQQLAHAASENSENCYHEKGESSGIAAIGEPSSAIASDVKEKVLEKNDPLAASKSNEKDSSEAKTDYSFNQEAAKSLQVREQDNDNSRLHDAKALRESVSQSNDSEEGRLSDHLGSPAVSSSDDGTQNYLHDELKASPAPSQSVATEEEMLDRTNGAMRSNNLRSSTASSSDDGSHEYCQMSRRTKKGGSEAKTEYSFNQEEDEKSLNVEEHSDSLRLNDKGKASPESVSRSNGSEEGFNLAHRHKRSDNLRSPTVTSSDNGTQNYFHGELKASPALSQSVASEEEMLGRPQGAMQSNSLRPSTDSSSDDGSFQKYRQMSRRTVRDHRFSGSTSTTSKERGENLSRNSSVNASAQMRGSLNSQSFFSVQSWVESEEEGPSRSPSRGSAFSEHPSKFQNASESTKIKNLQLLKLVEELRDQLTEKKPRSRFSYSRDTFHDDHPSQCPQQYRSSQMPVSYLHCHLEPSLCCNNRLCTACSYNFCCHSSKPRCSVQHQKGRTTKSYCRPVSGGAPFVTCSQCFEVLHMPADFLISTSHLNKLKCGACSVIMVLSFPARAHEVSQASNEAGKPSEDPISFSEEYGVSLTDSSSMEAEPVLNVSRASSRAGDSSKVSAAKLHRLMGYGSAKQLLF